ncbi:MAG: hypothetical protein R3B59_09475 [Dehalococcoidia bacterium]
MRIRAGLAVAFTTFALAACGSGDSDEAEAGWLLVLQGTVAAVGDGTLSLATGSELLAFTDRPQRLVEYWSVETLIDAWDEGGDFAASPPNAVIVDETDEQTTVVEILDASLDADTITFTYATLEGAPPALGDTIAVTIDAAPTSVNGQVTD